MLNNISLLGVVQMCFIFYFCLMTQLNLFILIALEDLGGLTTTFTYIYFLISKMIFLFMVYVQCCLLLLHKA